MPLFKSKKQQEKNEEAKKKVQKRLYLIIKIEIMPLFKSKKQQEKNEEAKKKVQKRLYLAKESPEPLVDLSECELTEVPSGLYSTCNVLRKENLLLYCNKLRSLSGGGDLKNLATIRVLDLHDNQLTKIPEGIRHMQCLQVLNLEKNKISTISNEIGQLVTLQTLNIKDNAVKVLTDDLAKLKSLRNLDLSGNPISSLPKDMCKIKSLEIITLSLDTLSYPPKDVAKQGTAAIMKFLCKECGIDYVPPSANILSVLDSADGIVEAKISGSNKRNIPFEDTNVEGAWKLYEKEQEKKRQERLEIERQFLESQQEQSNLAAKVKKSQESLVNTLARENADIEGKLKFEQSKQTQLKKGLVDRLQTEEHHSSQAVASILETNERLRNKENILKSFEEERNAIEKLVKVTVEEEEKLRKQEVLATMNKLLREQRTLEMIRKDYESNKDISTRKALESSVTDDEKIGSLIASQSQGKSAMIQHIANEETMQVMAFQALLFSKDAQNSRLAGEIMRLENELTTLSIEEANKRGNRQDTETISLALKREETAALLKQLTEEQARRQDELKNRLAEMEQRRDNEIKDYWLIQYQRLLDEKPKILIEMEHELDDDVVIVLEKAGALDMEVMFARHKVRASELPDMDDERLRQIGVTQVGARMSILATIRRYYLSNTSTNKTSTPTKSGSSYATPTATSDLSAECSICMDAPANVVFLDCGHVCTCLKCAEAMTHCPICRQLIIRKIRIFAT
ncbi:E3 ubiquitin-protein ligase LRSAM1 [Trichoplax sp. H2]|nr:E3 ubiquitin-protein ligase LRSAM1 [Trichoplax sp. H2]|eukprot:RDD43445.1 E3 ubiquitin-protein ligase LRSAM1 [Trichoplax sp. H2]